MSDYKRFVSYIYAYEHGEKKENAGFTKINARGGECKIWVHLRGFYTHGQRPYKTYLCTKEGEHIYGILLGDLENKNGALEWKGVAQTDSLMGTPFALSDTIGIYMESQGRIFAAEWEDYPVNVAAFKPYESSISQSSAGQSRKSSIKAEEIELKEPPAESPVKLPEAETEVLPEEAGKAAGAGDYIQAEEEEELAAAETAEISAEEENGEPFPDFFLYDTEPEDPKKEQWSYLKHHFPVNQHVEDGKTVISSIRLGPRDLSRLPREKWRLGNNSFLLHGYYQYRHLLLCRKQTECEISYLVGVPGIYNDREQMMASLFGFEEFRRLQSSGTRQGDFGYWCRRLI